MTPSSITIIHIHVVFFFYWHSQPSEKSCFPLQYPRSALHLHLCSVSPQRVLDHSQERCGRYTIRKIPWSQSLDRQTLDSEKGPSKYISNLARTTRFGRMMMNSLRDPGPWLISVALLQIQRWRIARDFFFGAHLTRSMTRSRGAELTGSSLIMMISSPGSSFPSDGPPTHTLTHTQWTWTSDSVHEELNGPCKTRSFVKENNWWINNLLWCVCWHIQLELSLN